MRLRSSLRHVLAVGIALGTMCSPLVGAAGSFATPDKHARRPPSVKPCQPSQLSVTLALTGLGDAPSSLAGAVLFSKPTSGLCSLKGIPEVSVVGANGQAIAVAQVPMKLRRVVRVTLSSSPTVTGALLHVGSSITWSGWGCPINSFALVVRFPGWRGSITVPYGTTSGYAGNPCTGGGASLYVGPVAQAASPA